MKRWLPKGKGEVQSIVFPPLMEHLITKTVNSEYVRIVHLENAYRLAFVNDYGGAVRFTPKRKSLNGTILELLDICFLRDGDYPSFTKAGFASDRNETLVNFQEIQKQIRRNADSLRELTRNAEISCRRINAGKLKELVDRHNDLADLIYTYKAKYNFY